MHFVKRRKVTVGLFRPPGPSGRFITSISEGGIAGEVPHGIVHLLYGTSGKAAPPGGDQMVLQFDVFCVEACEFTFQHSSAILEVGKTQLELWLPVSLGSAL